MAHQCNDPNHSHGIEDGIEYSLNKFLDTGLITCLNEKVKDSAKSIFKSWDDRFDNTHFLESCDDQELIINIPFNAVAQLKSIIIIGTDDNSAPSKMKAYLNHNSIDFGNINGITPAQEWILHLDLDGKIGYNTKITKFNNINLLTLYFPTNFGAPTTKIYYIGLKGVYTNAKREIVNTVYESRPQVADHKERNDTFVARDLINGGSSNSSTPLYQQQLNYNKSDPFKEEDHLYNITYFAREEIHLLQDLFNGKTTIDIDTFTETLIFQGLIFLTQLPNGIDILTNLFLHNEDIAQQHQQSSTPILDNKTDDFENVKKFDRVDVPAITTTTTTNRPVENIKIPSSSSASLSSPSTLEEEEKQPSTTNNSSTFLDDVDEEEEEIEENEDYEFYKEIYRNQFTLIKETQLYSGKTLQDPEFDFINSSTEILRWRRTISKLASYLYSYIQKKNNLASHQIPSLGHIIDLISSITRGTSKERSEIVFNVCKRKSRDSIYKSELYEIINMIGSLSVLNQFGYGTIGSPEEIINNIFRDGSSNLNSIQKSTSTQSFDKNTSSSTTSSSEIKDTNMEMNVFVKRAISNSDIPRCFGFFDLIYVCFVKPIEDYLDSNPGNHSCAGYLYNEKYLGIIKAYSLRWFEVRHGFLIGYKRLLSKPSKVICLFKTSVKVLPKEHPKHHHHGRLKRLFRANGKVIDRCKDATDFVLRREDDTFETFISMNPTKAAAFVNAIRANSKGSYRYQSFSGPRDDIEVVGHLNGDQYFKQIYHAIHRATSEIYIAGWWISPGISLIREGCLSAEKYRLDKLLCKKASEGVKIYILIWDETMIAMNLGSRFVKSIFEKLHCRNIKVIRHPYLLPLYWSHHQKLVVIDQRLAFIGGLDLCYGRYENQNYSLKDNDEKLFPGADYLNTCVFKPVGNENVCHLDRKYQPRMPWHDFSISLNGQAARDVAINFIQRWNHAKDANRDYKNYPYLVVSLEPLPPSNGTCKVQLVRSVCGWSAGQSLENSIYKAYISLISISQHFIYIQNQFFISSCGSNQSKSSNQIAFAIYKRIEKAILLKQTFRVIMLLPIHCEGDLFDIDTQLIVKHTLKSINGIKFELQKKFPDINIDQYFSVHSLRNWTINEKMIFTEQIYVHSKLMIVDDKIAIIGSANINDRSLHGSRDSEICAVVEDKNLVETTMDGVPYMAGIFAHQLRCQLWETHLGLKLYPNPELSSHIRDPIISSTYFNIWKSLSSSNTHIYKNTFTNLIPESCTKISQYNKTARLDSSVENVSKLQSIKGFLIDFPLEMLSEDEDPSSVYSDIITGMKLFL
eukprot:gene9277-11370_t